MKKVLYQILILVVLIILLVLVLSWQRYVERPGRYDATYTIDGQSVTLKDGVSTVPTAPGSALKIVTRAFGNDLDVDLDGDGRADKVFFLTRETGGSGVFFYVVARLNKVGERIGSDAVFIGDRIAPQTIDLLRDIRLNATSSNGLPLDPNIVVVNYADRNPEESFAVPPSEGKSLWLLLDTKTMNWAKVAVDFEGEAK